MPAGIDGAVRMAAHSLEYKSSPSVPAEPLARPNCTPHPDALTLPPAMPPCARAKAKAQRIRCFLLCERPCSSASRCPQGSMEPYAWPNTQRNTNHHRQMASPCKATPAEPSCTSQHAAETAAKANTAAAAAAKAADTAAGHCCQSIAKQPASWQ